MKNKKIILTIAGAVIVVSMIAVILLRVPQSENGSQTPIIDSGQVAEDTTQGEINYDDPNMAPIKNVVPLTVDIKSIKKYVKGKYRYEISNPTVTAQSNAQIAESINKSITKMSNDLKKRAINASDPNSQVDDEAGKGGLVEATMGVVSTYSSSKVFSLSVMTSFTNGKGDVNSFMKSYNYLPGHNKKMSMAQITGGSSEKLKNVNDSISKQLSDKKIELYNDNDYKLNQKSVNFYIKEDNLIVFYNEREIASSAEGIIEMEIKLSEIGFNASYPAANHQ